MIEAAELAEISRGIQEGKTPIELAQSGLASAVDPKVLN